jgi:hypothetical protein
MPLTAFVIHQDDNSLHYFREIMDNLGATTFFIHENDFEMFALKAQQFQPHLLLFESPFNESMLKYRKFAEHGAILHRIPKAKGVRNNDFPEVGVFSLKFPFSVFQLHSVLCKAIRWSQSRCKQNHPLENLFIRSDGRLLNLPWSEIEEVQALHDYVKIICKQGKHIIHCTMKEMEGNLPEEYFQRESRSRIIRKSNLNPFKKKPGKKLEVA